MIRNLLYSFFCHLFLACFLYVLSSTFIIYTNLDLTPNKPKEVIKIKDSNSVAPRPTTKNTVSPRVTTVSAEYFQNMDKFLDTNEIIATDNQAQFVNLDPNEAVISLPRKQISHQVDTVDVADALVAIKTKTTVYQQIQAEIDVLENDRIQAAKKAKRTQLADTKLIEKLLTEEIQAKQQAVAKQQAKQAAAKAKNATANNELAEPAIETTMAESVLNTEAVLSGSLSTEEGFKRNLSSRDKIQLQMQLVSCYKRAIQYNHHNSAITINVQVDLQRNGAMLMNKAKFTAEDSDLANNADEYNKAIQNARLALVYCNPLRNLPKDKYYLWKHLSFSFDIENLEMQLK